MLFQYFITEPRQNLTREHITRHGLHSVLRDRMTVQDLTGTGRLAVRDIVVGPGGLEGSILCPLTTDVRDGEHEGIGYYPQNQEWLQVPVPGDTGYWLGWNPASLPTPDDLQRDTIVSGYWQALGDGQQWACPVIRQKHGASNLPDVWRLKDGKVVSTVKPDWQWAWDLSGEVWDAMVAEGEIDQSLAFVWCAKLLSINYRIGPEECSVLGLFGRDEYRDVLQAAVNGPLIELLMEQQKKSSSPPIGE